MLECISSKVFIFRFLASQKLFFAKRCISGVLHSGMSYFQSFHFSIFSFPEAFFAKRCISGLLHSGMSYFQSFHFKIFSFPEAFFRKKLHFRSSALWNVLFPKFSFFDF